MKQFLISTLLFILFGHGATCQDTLYYQNFEEGFGDIIIYDLDSLVANPSAASQGEWSLDEGVYASSNAAISTSWYAPAGQSDDWMVLPKIMINESSSLSWTARSLSLGFEDSYQVLVSTTDSLPSSFSSEIFFIKAENTKEISRTVSLDDYIGESIFIAFRNISNDKDLLIIDDIVIKTSITSAVSNEFTQKNINIFPNPSDEYVEIKLEGKAFLIIYDSLGRSVYESEVINNHQIIKKETWKGSFYFSIRDQDNQITVKKIIFQ